LEICFVLFPRISFDIVIVAISATFFAVWNGGVISNHFDKFFVVRGDLDFVARKIMCTKRKMILRLKKKSVSLLSASRKCSRDRRARKTKKKTRGPIICKPFFGSSTLARSRERDRRKPRL
jgi:hypothetical protein